MIDEECVKKKEQAGAPERNVLADGKREKEKKIQPGVNHKKAGWEIPGPAFCVRRKRR